MKNEQSHASMGEKIEEFFRNVVLSIISFPYTIKNKRKKRVPYFDKEKYLVDALKKPGFETSNEYTSPDDSVWWHVMDNQEMYQVSASFFSLKNKKTKFSHKIVYEEWITWKPLKK